MPSILTPHGPPRCVSIVVARRAPIPIARAGHRPLGQHAPAVRVDQSGSPSIGWSRTAVLVGAEAERPGLASPLPPASASVAATCGRMVIGIAVY